LPGLDFQIRQASASTEPPLIPTSPAELTVAIAGLALGGAEWIVLDWARRIEPPWTAHLIVLRDHAHEWDVPGSIKVTRLHGVDVLQQLTWIGRTIGRSPVPVCVCHLLTAAERHAISAGGAFVVPVIHNAEAGWLEPAAALENVEHALAVSESSARDLRRHGFAGDISVIRHVPRRRQFSNDARTEWRRLWRIPADATVIGMIGAVKPQKDYPFAVRLLHRLTSERAAEASCSFEIYLVIVGGPIGKHGRATWEDVLAEMRQCKVRHRLAMPGFVADAARCLPAFDLLLNTSDYEGLSVATLDALVNGVPVVASRVGGQGELAEPGLTLLDKAAPLDDWADAVLRAVGSSPPRPAWTGFPSHRSWTLAHLTHPFDRTDRILFVTANLNAGGAQRSLVNLASARRHLPIEIAVTGDSTADYFFDALRSCDVPVYRTAPTRDPFDHAERLIHKICVDRIGIICFWNVDAKIKLLVTKALAFTDVALVDVSPGPSSFEEMRTTTNFSRLIAFTEEHFYARLDRLVLKYHVAAPVSCAAKATVIPNGVASPSHVKARYDVVDGGGRVAINGRIAPSKFIAEIVEAVAQVRNRRPHVELHVFGSVEPRHTPYAEKVNAAIADAIGRWVFFHDAGARTIDALADFDAFVVLGEHQGSPNALLEALAAGVPSIANDDGGTAEIVLDERTGLLVAGRSPSELAVALERILVDRELASGIGAAGRHHVLSTFSLDLMVSRYSQLFASLGARFEPAVEIPTEEKTA